MPNSVLHTPAAASEEALRYFSAKQHLETDCWDVHEALSGDAGFVLLDVRTPALYAQGHIPGAINLPHGKIVSSRLTGYPLDTLFVVYCAGPHCNGADKAAARLAALRRPVKLMIGGVTGWLDERFELTCSSPVSGKKTGPD